MRKSSLLVVTIAVTGALTLSACGSRGAKSGSDNAGGGTTKVVIGVDAPLSGKLSALGLGIKNSADLAAKKANKDKLVPGVTFSVEAKDDQANPTSGKQNATALVDMKDVVGVVGPLNSSVSQTMQKVFNDGKLTQVSPANTSPELSLGPDWGSSKFTRQYATYFRTATTDVVQGKFAAQYLFNEAKKTKVYVIDDKKTYGAGLAAIFQDEFKKLGGTVVGTDHINPDDKDFSAVATKVASSGADSVYYGGEYPEGGPLTDQIKKAGAKVPLFGGDGIYDPEFIKLSNNNSEGDLATSVGAPVDELDSAKTFISDYKAEGYKEPYAAYGGYSYDAAWSIIEAVKAAVEHNGGKVPSDLRAKVLEEMGKVKFAGVTGQVSFDQYGDTTNKQLTVYSVKGPEWKAVKSGTYTG
ncbi:branched-chain amino acid ABC transporter substrate-binding protein [Kitasatospora sp. NPDC059646]|uniref:Branched-chain amino acid ABC transporter substrate-binding protein n=1 Tax=Kitasatospora cheerisanensis KCTC 2395 TaxID=1348663 RepID=A0A066YYF7_9ACTN|nr:branched-chain amino acid ABC transporter substrate-binding protein [Kitasatospora cheerisanensis]KDN86242.1 branched-chain amino acid ABC transporter substrate-binding protein [Kitasatospora cheerisanensis KCTC 2395]